MTYKTVLGCLAALVMNGCTLWLGDTVKVTMFNRYTAHNSHYSSSAGTSSTGSLYYIPKPKQVVKQEQTDQTRQHDSLLTSFNRGLLLSRTFNEPGITKDDKNKAYGYYFLSKRLNSKEKTKSIGNLKARLEPDKFLDSLDALLGKQELKYKASDFEECKLIQKSPEQNYKLGFNYNEYTSNRPRVGVYLENTKKWIRQFDSRTMKVSIQDYARQSAIRDSQIGICNVLRIYGNDPTSKRKDQDSFTGNEINLALFYSTAYGFLSILDINNDGYIGLDDDVNGDGNITIDDKIAFVENNTKPARSKLSRRING